MAGIFGLKDLQARKRALVAESEIYRQTLTLEIRNVRLYSAALRRKFAFVSASKPLLIFGLPWLTSLFKRRKRRRVGLLKVGFVGWKLYRMVSPLLRRFRKQAYTVRSTISPHSTDGRAPAANI